MYDEWKPEETTTNPRIELTKYEVNQMYLNKSETPIILGN